MHRQAFEKIKLMLAIKLFTAVIYVVASAASFSNFHPSLTFLSTSGAYQSGASLGDSTVRVGHKVWWYRRWLEISTLEAATCMLRLHFFSLAKQPSLKLWLSSKSTFLSTSGAYPSGAPLGDSTVRVGPYKVWWYRRWLEISTLGVAGCMIRLHLFSLAKQPNLKLKSRPRPKRYIAEADLVFILERTEQQIKAKNGAITLSIMTFTITTLNSENPFWTGRLSQGTLKC